MAPTGLVRGDGPIKRIRAVVLIPEGVALGSDQPKESGLILDALGARALNAEIQFDRSRTLAAARLQGGVVDDQYSVAQYNFLAAVLAAPRLCFRIGNYVRSHARGATSRFRGNFSRRALILARATRGYEQQKRCHRQKQGVLSASAPVDHVRAMPRRTTSWPRCRFG